MGTHEIRNITAPSQIVLARPMFVLARPESFLSAEALATRMGQPWANAHMPEVNVYIGGGRIAPPQPTGASDKPISIDLGHSATLTGLPAPTLTTTVNDVKWSAGIVPTHAGRLQARFTADGTPMGLTLGLSNGRIDLPIVTWDKQSVGFTFWTWDDNPLIGFSGSYIVDANTAVSARIIVGANRLATAVPATDATSLAQAASAGLDTSRSVYRMEINTQNNQHIYAFAGLANGVAGVGIGLRPARSSKTTYSRLVSEEHARRVLYAEGASKTSMQGVLKAFGIKADAETHIDTKHPWTDPAWNDGDRITMELEGSFQATVAVVAGGWPSVFAGVYAGVQVTLTGRVKTSVYREDKNTLVVTREPTKIKSSGLFASSVVGLQVGVDLSKPSSFAEAYRFKITDTMSQAEKDAVHEACHAFIQGNSPSHIHQIDHEEKTLEGDKALLAMIQSDNKTLPTGIERLLLRQGSATSSSARGGLYLRCFPTCTLPEKTAKGISTMRTRMDTTQTLAAGTGNAVAWQRLVGKRTDKEMFLSGNESHSETCAARWITAIPTDAASQLSPLAAAERYLVGVVCEETYTDSITRNTEPEELLRNIRNRYAFNLPIAAQSGMKESESITVRRTFSAEELLQLASIRSPEHFQTYAEMLHNDGIVTPDEHRAAATKRAHQAHIDSIARMASIDTGALRGFLKSLHGITKKDPNPDTSLPALSTCLQHFFQTHGGNATVAWDLLLRAHFTDVPDYEVQFASDAFTRPTQKATELALEYGEPITRASGDEIRKRFIDVAKEIAFITQVAKRVLVYDPTQLMNDAAHQGKAETLRKSEMALWQLLDLSQVTGSEMPRIMTALGKLKDIRFTQSFEASPYNHSQATLRLTEQYGDTHHPTQTQQARNMWRDVLSRLKKIDADFMACDANPFINPERKQRILAALATDRQTLVGHYEGSGTEPGGLLSLDRISSSLQAVLRHTLPHRSLFSRQYNASDAALLRAVEH